MNDNHQKIFFPLLAASAVVTFLLFLLSGTSAAFFTCRRCAVLAGLMLFFSLYFIVMSRLLKMPLLLTYGLFLLSQLVSSVCVTKVFFIMTGVLFPEKCVPFVISLCMTVCYALVRTLNIPGFSHRITEAGLVCCAYFASVVNLFLPSLNIVLLLMAAFIVFIAYNLIKGRKTFDDFALLTQTSLLPWACVCLANTVNAVAGRHLLPAVPVLPMLSSFSSSLLCLLFMPLVLKRDQELREKKLVTFFTGDKSVTMEELLSSDSVSGSTVRSLLEKIIGPVEQVQDAALQLQKGEAEPMATARFIQSNVHELKKCIGKEMNSLLSSSLVQSSVQFKAGICKEPAADGARVEASIELRKKIVEETVCLFGEHSSSFIALQKSLVTAGVQCVLVTEESDLFKRIEANEVQLLIVEPSVAGAHASGAEDTRAFDVCKRVRGAKNMLEFPILMVVSYFENEPMQYAYRIGVNDFIIRPFESSELTLRVSFLLQLQTLYQKNEALALSEKEKRTFLYFVTHNVNTPLALLENRIAELVDNDSFMEAVDKDTVDDIEESVSEIHDIIQNVLISFRISDGRYMNTAQKINVSHVFESVKPQAQMKASLKQQQLVWICPPTIEEVSCNEHALRGILVNLIDNAIKFSPAQNGKVTVCVEKNKDGTIVISVNDNGPGIPKEKRAVIFEKFADRGTVPSANEKSIGLGLYVAHELAAMNGISLSYRDGETGGACFSLTF